MGKHKKPSRNLPTPADVLAGRVRLDARDLIALIREVNPTGLGLDRKETTARYALKSRLQSALVRAFPDEIDAFDKADEAGVISLRHRSLGLDACHALLAELDDDARATIQYLLDTRGADEPAASHPKTAQSRQDHALANPIPLGVPTPLTEGHAALEAYDYDLARQRFEEAFDTTGGGKEAAHALLSLFVEQLGADQEALALQDKLAGTARTDPALRGLLAIAAARSGQRARALSLVEERGSKPLPAHVAEIFVLLAKNALAEGDLPQASNDLGRATEQMATHPEIVTVADALAKARASARGPVENQLSALFAVGQFREAEALARQVLGRFGDSEVARRILRAIEDQKKRALAEQLLGEARNALETGDDTRGITLVRAALATGLAPDGAAWAEARIAAIEMQERQRFEEARVADTLRLLGTQSLGDGLSAYALLPEPSRRKVAERISMRAISWLDDLCSPRDSGKASAIVEAIVALERGMELFSVDPAEALDLVAAHDKVLSGFKPAEELRRAALHAIAEQQRRTAQNRLELARQVLMSGDPQRAQRIANDIVPKHLSEQDTQVLSDLRMQIQKTLERSAFETALEEHQRQSNPLRVLALAQRLAARAEGEQVARLDEVFKELREQTRHAFSVRIEHAGEKERVSPQWNLLYDARILPKWKFETLMPDPEGGPDDLLLVLVQVKAGWVFIRVLEVATGVVRTRVTLRTPIIFEVLRLFLRNGRLFLIGRMGALLEIDVHDWAVLQWCPNILRPTETKTKLDREPELSLLMIPGVMIDNCTISLDGRYLWVDTISSRVQGDRDRRVLHIIDLESSRVVRELRDHPHGNVYCCALGGLDRPCIAIVENAEDYGRNQTYFYDPRGRLLWKLDKPMSISPLTLTAHPDGTHVFGATSDPDGPKDPMTVRWGYCQMSMQSSSAALDYSLDTTAVYEISAVTHRPANMCFLLINGRQSNELLGLRPNEGGFEIVYRAPVPRYSALVSTPDGSRAVLLVVHSDRHEFVQLGATAPKFEQRDGCAPFLVPSLPLGSLNTRFFVCHQPSGARARCVAVIENEVRKWGKARYRERVRVAKKRGDPMELLDLEGALLNLHDPSLAGELNAYTSAKFAHHPRVRLVSCYHLAAVGRWAETLAEIESIDPEKFDEVDAKHLHHMRGICQLMLGQPELAMAEFASCMTYTEGPCDPEELMALCKPLEGDTTPWKPEWVVLRKWLRHVVTADEAFARADVRAAREAIDVPIVWDAQEVQSMARLAEALLRESEVGNSTTDPFHQALAMATLCDLAEARQTMTRREVPLPRAMWEGEKLGNIVQRARRWLDSVFAVGPQGKSRGC